MAVVIVVEGDTDLPIARKLAADAGFRVAIEIDSAGKDRLDQRLAGYNAAAQGSPWFVLRDLDDDAQCAAAFQAHLALRAERWLCFRLAVRELESWLLADSAAIASFLAIPGRLVPTDPDAEEDPTRTIVNLARRSRRRAVQRDMVPGPRASVAVGPLYEARIIEFAERHWDLERASARSDSLSRARRRLRELAGRWKTHINEGARLA